MCVWWMSYNHHDPHQKHWPHNHHHCDSPMSCFVSKISIMQSIILFSVFRLFSNWNVLEFFRKWFLNKWWVCFKRKIIWSESITKICLLFEMQLMLMHLEVNSIVVNSPLSFKQKFFFLQIMHFLQLCLPMIIPDITEPFKNISFKSMMYNTFSLNTFRYAYLFAM